MRYLLLVVRNIVILLNISILVLLVGCDPKTNAPLNNALSNKVVGLSMHFMRDDYSVSLTEAFSDAMEKEDIKYIITDGNGDPKKQIADIENLIAQNVDIIGVCPMDEIAIKNTLNEAVKKGIPVVSITHIPDVNVDVTISGGDYANGKGAGESMLKALNGKGEIVVFDMPFDVNRAKERLRGFMETIKNSDIKILDTMRPATNEETMEVVKNLLAAYPELDGIFACFSNQMIGCGAALKALNRQDVIVTGIDADMAIINMLLDGYLTSAAAQFPKEHGRLTAEAMINILKGDTFQKTYEAPFKMVDKKNAVEMAKVLWGKDIK